MERAPRERRTPRGVISPLVTVGLVAGMLALAPGAAGGANACWARNVTQGTPSGTDLQAVIAAASPGDRIAVKFVCVGNFTIGIRLSLVGKPTEGVPKPVLDANGEGRVLLTSARVRLTNLKITGGLVSTRGGGISNTGTLTLRDTVVSENSAIYRGGIYNNGTLTLMDSVVSGNTANFGSGIYNFRGTLTLNGSSSVSGNTAAFDGGVYNRWGDLILNDSSSVRDNTARFSGGGIFMYRGSVTLNGSSSVSGNTAETGGGISNADHAALTLNDSSSVSENTADFGGGIVNHGIVTLNGSSSVSGNTAGSGGGIFNFTPFTMNDSSSVSGNTADVGGGIYDFGPFTMNGSSSVSGNTADVDDLGSGSGGGIFSCGGSLTGVIDGGNVNDNYRGTASPVEDNISVC